MDDFNAKIKEFIITEVAPDLGLTDIQDDEPLIESGIVDSLGVLRIMAFLDESFGIDLGAGEIKLESFKDLRSIRAMVEAQGLS
jgi:acyl carrier protein